MLALVPERTGRAQSGVRFRPQACGCAYPERLAKQGIEPQTLGVDAFNALLREDFAKMAKVVKASGARID